VKRHPKGSIISQQERSSTRRQAGLDMLLNGYTQAEVARELSVDPAAVCRWTQDPGFHKDRASVRKARRDENAEKLQRLIPLALTAAEEILTNPKAPEWAKLRAMENILQRSGFAPTKPDGDPSNGSTFSAVVDMMNQRLGIQVRGPNQQLQAESPPGQGLGPDRGMTALPEWASDSRWAPDQDDDRLDETDGTEGG